MNREARAVVIRPLQTADVVAAQDMSYATMRQAGRDFGWEMPEADDESRHRGTAHKLHCIKHDPGGCFVAEAAGELVGVALSIRRGPLWFLSLLAVDPSMQALGVGRQLLDATLQTMGDRGLICASDDPKALRRYRLAGFDLLPGFHAKGELDRSLVPAGSAVRDGSYADDRELIESVAILQRGVGYGVDLEYAQAVGLRLFVVESAAGRGYVMVNKTGAVVLGATTPAAAAALLWTALAEATDDKVDVSWLTHAQQWGIDVALAARLPLRPAGSLCVRGPVGPLSPYLPAGSFG